MKKYILILALLITGVINVNAWTIGTCANNQFFPTPTTSATQTLIVSFTSNDISNPALGIVPAPNTTFTIFDYAGTQYIATYTNQYGQSVSAGSTCGGNKFTVPVKVPIGFVGIITIGNQTTGVTNPASNTQGVKCYIGVSDVSKVKNIQLTATSTVVQAYTVGNLHTTDILTYSVNLAFAEATQPNTLTLVPFSNMYNAQTFSTTNGIMTFTNPTAGVSTTKIITVTAYNGTKSQYKVTYNVASTPPVTLSNNCTLTNLTTSVGTLTPTFATTQTTYTVTLPYLTTLPTTLTTANFSYSLPSGATISSSTTAILTATNSVSTLTFVVRAEDNVTTKTYKIIYRLASPDNNANLASLSSSQGTLSPAFSPNTQIYTVTLPFGVEMDNSLLVATTQSSFATITTNTISGNSKVVAVKAQAGNTKSYRVDYSNAPDPTLSVHENSFNETVVYPNPTKDKLFIKSENAIKNVVVYNVDGKVVEKQNTQEVDIKHLPAGVYYIEINQNKNKTKIIKE